MSRAARAEGAWTVRRSGAPAKQATRAVSRHGACSPTSTKPAHSASQRIYLDQMSQAVHYHMFQLVLVANSGEFGGSNA